MGGAALTALCYSMAWLGEVLAKLWWISLLEFWVVEGWWKEGFMAWGWEKKVFEVRGYGTQGWGGQGSGGDEKSLILPWPFGQALIVE